MTVKEIRDRIEEKRSFGSLNFRNEGGPHDHTA